MSISLRARLFETLLTVLPTQEYVVKQANRPVRPKHFFQPQYFQQYSAKQQLIDQHEVVTLNSDKPYEKHIIFFHGGAYTLQISYFHWQLIKQLLKHCAIKISVVDYPLSPEHTANETVPMAVNSVKALCSQYPDDNFLLMGDSAGGGLAMIVLQQLLLSQHDKLPVAIILASPWLNLNREVDKLEQLDNCDQMVSSALGKYCANQYRGHLALTDPKLSPIYGMHIIQQHWQALQKNDFKALVLYSDSELIREDSEELDEFCQQFGDAFSFRRYQGMQHVWLIFPIPEAKQAIRDIADFIQQL